MGRARVARMLVVLVLLAAAFVWISQTRVPADRVNLFIAALIGAVTTIYALFTFEILIQNQTMARAALDSSTLMERSLRFSHSANLLYETINTKDPTFKTTANTINPIENPDFKRAITEFNEGAGQTEFVFAVLTNEGHGAATNIDIEATYNVIDSGSVNRESTVTKRVGSDIGVKAKRRPLHLHLQSSHARRPSLACLSSCFCWRFLPGCHKRTTTRDQNRHPYPSR